MVCGSIQALIAKKVKAMENLAAAEDSVSSCQIGFGGLVGESEQMRHLHQLIGKISQSNCSVLLIGDTGTGKELVARAIHYTGSRRLRAFIPVDGSALTPTLIESELFGHVRGAFTGADCAKRGLLQTANGGTVFLDEVGELPMCLQAKLLRALQEREIRPVGSTERIPIDVRVIAATNRDLEAGIRAGTFRQDLYFRLNVVEVRLPALRDRKVDIPQLVAHFIEKFSDSPGLVRRISNAALRKLISYDWPGNVRELENAIECAMALSIDAILTEDDLASLPDDALERVLGEGEALFGLAEVERRAVLHAMRESGGNKVTAARLLGIGKTTLYRKLKEYGGVLRRIDPDQIGRVVG
jgi:transcriptional regulator with PAS, ATPase and Fis domain